MIIGLALPYIKPLRYLLGFAKPANSYLGFLIVELVLYCIQVELIKRLYIRVFKVWL